jgi:hypothetical protein
MLMNDEMQSVRLNVVVNSPIQFHGLCSNGSKMGCFEGRGYVCYCDGRRSRASCVRYDEDLDRCGACLHGGRCVIGDRGEPTSSVCICPSYYLGDRCQFDLNSLS